MLLVAEKTDPAMESAPKANNGTWLEDRVARGKEGIATVWKQTKFLVVILKHRRAPWTSRAIALAAVLYLVSPVQLIPSFVPVIGQVDDLLVIFWGMKLVRRLTPGDIAAECEQQSEAPLFRSREISAIEAAG
jgi:uncharacterized membrane protein YkvA (DUF1232 family)